MPEIKTSASQVSTFRNCNRLWFYQRILKIRPPQTPAQSKGSTIHGVLEAYLKAGEIEPEILARAESLGLSRKQLDAYIDAIKPFVGKPGEGLTEFRDEMPTYEGGPPFVLIVDHAREVTVEKYGTIPQIDDLKTTSDFRYCKTPEQLAEDTQMISYGKWALWRLQKQALPEPQFVSLRHVYARTRGKCVGTARDTLVTPDHIEEQWQKILVDVRAMTALSDASDSAVRLHGEQLDPGDVPATTTNHCSAYGGCYFRSKCFGAIFDGSRPLAALFHKTNNTTEKTVSENNVVPGNFPPSGTPADTGVRLSLADRLRLKREAEAAAAAGGAPAASAAPAAAVAPAQTSAAPAASTGAVCGVRSDLLTVNCTLVPHTGDHESRATSGGVVHWTQDGTNVGTGPSTNWKPLVPAAAPAAAAVSMETPNVLAPDAASRTTTPEQVAEANAPKGRKPRAAKASAADAGTTPDAAAPTPVAVTAAAGVCQLETLYIDCYPVKNGGNMPATAEGLIAEISEAAALLANVPDWRLVEFGKGKGAMAIALRERLGHVAKELVVSTSTPGADVVIEVLAPHAKRVIKALRG